MIFINMGTQALQNNHMRVHGHTFDIIKMSLPTLNGSVAERDMGLNTDIMCDPNSTNEETA